MSTRFAERARAAIMCTYASDQMLGSAVGSGGTRISKPAYAGNGRLSRNGDVQARLDRLESLLEKAVSGNPPPQQSLPRYTRYEEEQGHDSELSPSATSQTSQGAGISSDNNDGTLLLDGGQSKFVSSLHYALLADEVNDSLSCAQSDSDRATRFKISKRYWATERTRHQKVPHRTISSMPLDLAERN
jgi:hypothetical protein